MAHVAASHGGPIVLADVGDNAGGGAMSDSNFVLQGMLDAGIGNAAIGCYWDLGAIALCKSAGVGATLDLRIGGKCGPLTGKPIDLRSEEHTSELQSLMRISYAVFCLKKKKIPNTSPRKTSTNSTIPQQ